MLSGGGRALSVLLILLVILAAVACKNDMPANAFSGTLTVNVSDALPKTLSYKPVDGELEINAFSVSIANSSGTELKNNADSPIALSGGSGAFVITGLTTGTYTVTVTGYLNDNGTYHDIATGTAKDIHLTPSSPDTVNVVIDTFVDEPASSVTVDVTMPTDVLVNGSVEGTMTYSLTDPKTGEAVVSEKSVSVTGVVDGVYSLTIPESVDPGRYVLLLGFTATGDDCTYRGAEAMLVYPGLPVTGSVSLDSQHAFEAGFTVTDKIGSELVYDYEEGALVSEDGSFTVTLDRDLPEGTSVSWYVDAVETEADVSGRAYTFTGLSAGKRSVVAIFWDETAAGVGTLTVDVVVKGEMGVRPVRNIFTFALNPDGKSYEVTGFVGDVTAEEKEHLVFPGTYQGLPVTSVSGGNYFGAKTIQLPDSIEIIKSWTFSQMFDVEGTIILPKNLKRIEESAFFATAYNKPSTTFNVVFPDGLEYIGENAFQQCYFTEDITIPGTVKEIAAGAFAGSFAGIYTGENAYATMILEDGIEKIGNQAFAQTGMGDDRIFRIPPSVKEFGSGNFGANGVIYAKAVQVGWPSWQKPEGWADDWNLTSSGRSISMPIIYEDGKYQDDSFYYNRNEDGTFTIAMIKDDSPAVLVIPSEFNGQPITAIGDNAFGELEYDGDLVIPDGIKTIGAYAFGKAAFSSLSLPESLSLIKEDAFSGCTMSSLDMPIAGELEIGDYAFASCGQLECTIIILEGASLTVGTSVFYGCKNVSVVVQGGTLNGDLGSDVDVSYDFS